MVHTHVTRGAVVAIHLTRPMLEVVAIAIAPRPRLSKPTNEVKEKHGKTGCLRVFPALVVDLVHVAVALVVGILGLDIEYLGLIQELEVETEHLFVLRVLGIVSLGRSHGRKICRVILVP